MSRRTLALALGAVLLMLLPAAAVRSGPAPAAEDPAPAARSFDLDGVPTVELKPPRRAFQPVRIEDPAGRPGWVVRLVPVPSGRPNPGAAFNVPTPAVDDGRVIVGAGASSTVLHGFDARSGKRLWTTKLNDNGPSAVAVTRGRAYVNTESCTTYAVETRTGRRIWANYLGPNLMASPTVARDRVLAAYRTKQGNRFRVGALSLRDGRLIWHRDFPADLVGAPVYAEDRVYVTGQDGTLACLDQKDGRLRWNRRMGAGCAPWYDLGGVYVTTAGPARNGAPVVVRLDPRDGRTLWRSDRPREATGELVTVARRTARTPPPTSQGWCPDPPRPVVLGDRCVIAGGREMLVLDAGTGRCEQRLLLPDGRRFHAPPAVLGRRLLYATADGLLVEVDPALGAVRRALDLGVPITSQPVVDGGRAFVTSGAMLVAVPWGDPDDPSWPQWGGTAERSIPAAALTEPVRRRR